MTDINALFSTLHRLGIRLSREGDNLRVAAPSKLGSEVIDQIRANKGVVILEIQRAETLLRQTEFLGLLN